MNAFEAVNSVDRSALSKSACAIVLCMSASARSAVTKLFMGRSFLSGMVLRDFHSHTRLDRPAHFPRTTGHALPCSAQTDFLGAGAHALHRLRNPVRPAMGRAQGRIGGRGLRGFSYEFAHG